MLLWGLILAGMGVGCYVVHTAGSTSRRTLMFC